MKEENISPESCFTDCALHFSTSHWTTSSITCKILTVNSTKYFWLFSPTQLLTHGQWWSILRMHLLQTLKEHRYLLTALSIPETQSFTGVQGTNSGKDSEVKYEHKRIYLPPYLYLWFAYSTKPLQNKPYNTKPPLQKLMQHTSDSFQNMVWIIWADGKKSVILFSFNLFGL